MKLRLATKDDEGPFLAGLIKCDHYAGGSSVGGFNYNPRRCPRCHGTGWVNVAVLLVEEK